MPVEGLLGVIGMFLGLLVIATMSEDYSGNPGMSLGLHYEFFQVGRIQGISHKMHILNTTQYQDQSLWGSSIARISQVIPSSPPTTGQLVGIK